MGKRPAAKCFAGMMEVRTVATDDELSAVRKFFEQEAVARQSLDWVRKLRTTLEPLYKRIKRPADDPILATLCDVYELTDSVLADSFPSETLPEIVRRCYHLGAAHSQLEMLLIFDGMVKSARRQSQSNALKSKSILNEKQWAIVSEFIASRPKGVSVLERCRQARTCLLQGSMKGLAGLRVEITADALRKRFGKR